ncbi:PP2C family serine/threonine-protein phosphatase [Microbacterium sp. SORGH_AS_0888]|uniref:PP2C family protein-serine/threonine phosphatase n=1 Tax=Microbacterium sp. SORGH_AS_0888 TaxID=3041791 RepID=UPI0027813471|nr:protein phosphatase 2C domain-containing protein [Microbacterium sp. SORGH_AS_0888]MDQ1129162.1 serine/threonine protein phosphatase PrpC [Microbacterium sp. SORGH_AS_0888]
MTVMTPLSLSVGAQTDAGRRRTVNEDSYLAEYPVFVVADGMGGHDAGDLASAAVVEAFRPLVGQEDVPPEAVTAAVARAHAAVGQIGGATHRGAGSTLTGIVAVRQNENRLWLVVNIGDSRVYRLIGNSLQQVTVDHSVAQEMVDAGTLARDQMSNYKGRNVITRAVGDPASEADYWLVPMVTGERLLVCSDGLSGELADEALRAGLALGGGTAQTAHSLVAQAVERGGRDNITAIVVDVLAGGANPDSDDVTGGLAHTGAAATSSIALDEDTRPSVRRGRRR